MPNVCVRIVAVNGTHRPPDALAPLINVRSGAEGDKQTPNVTKCVTKCISRLPHQDNPNVKTKTNTTCQITKPDKHGGCVEPTSST